MHLSVWFRPHRLLSSQSHPQGMMRTFPLPWTLQTAFDTTFAPVWYCTDTKPGHLCYYKESLIKRGIKRRIFNISLLPNNPIFTIIGGFTMTENEKKLLQAKHRLEEAEARNRVKERKARTRRLIQEGAVLEKAFPRSAQMTLGQLEDYLCGIFKSIR